MSPHGRRSQGLARNRPVVSGDRETAEYEKKSLPIINKDH
jgi:hypothetical protein